MLKLSVETKMKIHFLGTSGWYDIKEGNTICTLIDSKDCYIILDAGNGIYKSIELLKEEKPIYVFLSHLHLDHIVGFHVFSPLMGKRKFSIVLQKGNADLLKNIVCFPYMAPFNKKTVFQEIEEGNYEKPFKFDCLKLSHASPTLGYRFYLEGKIISYCLDTGVCENLEKLAQNSDLFITEASIVPGVSNPEWGHLNPEEAAQTAVKSNAKRMIMTHLSVTGYKKEEEKEIASEKAKNILKNSEFAKDDLIIEL